MRIDASRPRIVRREASILAARIARTQTLPASGQRRFLNDALLLMISREIGATLISANIADFDLLNQVRSDAKLLLYRAQ